MSRHKKRHNCKNHHSQAARGRCSLCGSWICKSCAFVRSGQLFCADTCMPVHNSDNGCVQQISEGESVDSKQIRKSVIENKKVASVLLFCIVSGLFGIIYGSYQYQLRMTIQSELTDMHHKALLLEEDYRHLKQLFKQTERRIDYLDSLAQRSPTPQKSSFTHPSPKAAPPILSKDQLSTLPLSVVNGTLSKKVVSLTFDGGSYNNATSQILDTLASRGVTATMFLTGQFMKRHRQTVKEILAAGHEIGNHTMSHPHLTSWAQNRRHTTLTGVTRSMIGSQLTEANSVFRSITGEDLAPLWRAPYGEKNKQICSWALSYGFIHIAWKQGRTWSEGYDSNDWVPDQDTPGYHPPQAVYEKYMRLAGEEPDGMNGGILLFHLGTARKKPEQQVHRILGKLIDGFHEKGYQIVPTTVLLEKSGVDLTPLKRDHMMVKN